MSPKLKKLIRISPYYFVICSILIHFFIWSGLNFLAKTQNHPQFTHKPLEIVITEEKTTKKSLPNHSLQIVEQNQLPLNDETPDKARFLSQHNQRVVRETKAAHSGAFQNKSSAHSASQSIPLTKSSVSKNTPKTTQKKSNLEEERNGEEKLPSIADLRPQFQANPLNQLNPEPSPTSDSQGVNQSDDYLKDTERGLQTLLNTKEFVYYSYYNRIKEKIKQYWEPNIRENVKMAIRKGRSIASSQDRITRVLITLDRNGTLVSIKIIGESGIGELDAAAVDAFRSASPFPHPPQGMIETDGNIHIRWDFILEA